MRVSRPWRSSALVIAIAALLLAAPVTAWAQADTGVIDGRVLDESKAAVPGVTVTARNVATGFARSGVSGSTGTYRLEFLPPGTYQVTAELTGFATMVFPAAIVQVGTSTNIDFTMKVAAVAEATLAMLYDHRIRLYHPGTIPETQEHVIFLPAIILVNKCDDASTDEDFAALCELFEGDCPLLPLAALSGRYFERLAPRLLEALDVIRVYAKPPGRDPDLDTPFVLKKGSTVAELARKIHRDFYEKLKSARVWGSSAFEGQMVQRDYELKEGDIVEFKA